MPYPFHILKKEKISASAQDVETFIRHALGEHWLIVEKLDLDETGKRFQLYFWQRDIGLDRYMDDGEIGKIHWGGAEFIEWSDSTEIVRMWAATPGDWYVGMFDLDRDKVIEESFQRLEELSNEILKHFQHYSRKTQNVTQANYIFHVQGDFIEGNKSMAQNIKMENSSIGGNVVAADNINDSFNIIQNAPIKDELKEQLALLTEAVAEMIAEMPKEEADEVADDMKRLAEEVVKPSPSKKWYSVSIDGLVKAAENIDKVGEPVIKAAGKVLALLAAL